MYSTKGQSIELRGLRLALQAFISLSGSELAFCAALEQPPLKGGVKLLCAARISFGAQYG